MQGRVFPSSERRGGCAIKKMLRSLLMKAQTGWSVPDNVSRSTFTLMTTPSAPLRRLRAFFLLAQPPLLFQEGNTLSWQFIHTFQAGGSRLPNPRACARGYILTPLRGWDGASLTDPQSVLNSC